MPAFQIYRLPAAVLFTGGVLAPGWKVRFFLTTTTTPTPVYTTSALNVAHTQPVEADSAGVLPVIYLDPAITYKSEVYDENDVLQPDFGADPVNDNVVTQEAVESLIFPVSDEDVSHLSSGAGAVARTVRSILREEIRVDDFGAAGDGVTDDADAFFAALAAANGRPIKLGPHKIYRTTQNLDAQGATRIKIIGAAYGYLSHRPWNFAQLNNDPLYRITGSGTPGSSVAVSDEDENEYMLSVAPGHSIIKCDGCDLIGAPDTGTMNAANDTLDLLENLVVWGVNGAKHGVYVIPMDVTVRNCTFILFEHYGWLQRAGITTKLDTVAFEDCGWNLANSGTAGYPNTYNSGCGIKAVSNMTAGDYTTVNGSYRPTTFRHRDCFVRVRGHTTNNKSGLRGVQAHGVLSMNEDCYGAYTGSFYDICQVGIGDGYHYENYQDGGFVAGDHTPFCAYFLNSQFKRGIGYAANVGSGITAGLEAFGHLDTGNTSLPSFNATGDGAGNVESIGPSLSTMQKSITVGTASSTQNYLFKNILTTGNGAGSKGFTGLVTVTLIMISDLSKFSRGAWVLSRHYSGSSHVLTPAQLAYESTVSAGFDATVLPNFSGNDLSVAVTWGASWSVSDEFYLDVSMHGIRTHSV